MRILLSEQLNNYMPNIQYQIINEKEVSVFGLNDCKIDDACIYINSEKYIGEISDNVRMIITKEELKDKFISDRYGLLIVDDPKVVFWQLHEYIGGIDREKEANNISLKATIGQYVSIADNNVVIEDDVIIEDFVSIYENSHIKKGSIIRSGSKVGSMGFRVLETDDNVITNKHYGGVIIEEGVDIHSNSCIDRALFSWDNTIIGKNTIVDNNVHIAHACKLGKNCLLAAGVTIAGNCVVGDHVWFGIGAILSNRVNVGSNSRVNIGSVVVEDVKEGESVSGNYAIPHNEFLFNQLRQKRNK